MAEFRNYPFKLYPNVAQDARLHEIRRLHCQLYNAALEERIGQWQRECERHGKGDRKGLGYYDQSRSLTELRADMPEIAALGFDSAALTLDRLDKAFKAFFRRAKAGAGASSGYPRFKSSRDYPGFSYRKHRSGWRLDFKDGWRNGRARLGDVPGTVRFMGRLPAEPEAIKTCDVLWRDGHWWLSVCVAIARPRTAGEHDMRIRFDLIDRFASVQIGADGPCGAGLDADFQSADGRIIPLPQGSSSHPGQTSSETGGERRDWNRHRIDEIQSARDRCKRGSIRWRRLNARKRKIEGAIARRRREAYHVWTSAMIAEAKALTVIRPASIKDDTKSGHGTDRDPGAATELKAAFNRRVLDQAPALAVQMLAYKAAEAGVEYHEADHEDLAVGNATVRNHKAVRKVRRAVKHLQPETRP